VPWRTYIDSDKRRAQRLAFLPDESVAGSEQRPALLFITQRLAVNDRNEWLGSFHYELASMSVLKMGTLRYQCLMPRHLDLAELSEVLFGLPGSCRPAMTIGYSSR
jgi:hypothetical protein